MNANIFVAVSKNFRRAATGSLDDVRDFAVQASQKGTYYRVLPAERFIASKVQEADARARAKVQVGAFDPAALKTQMDWLVQNGYSGWGVMKVALRNEPLSAKQIRWIMTEQAARQARDEARSHWTAELGLA